jgi:hypothetical protein
MNDYQTLITDLVNEHVSEQLSGGYADNRKEVLESLLDDTENVFGNMEGSRTCSTYQAQQFIDKSGAIWDEDILNLFADMGDDYFTKTLKRGAETLDVVICELLAPQVISEMLEEEA